MIKAFFRTPGYCLATLICLWAAPTVAQDFPNRSVRIILPYVAGNGADTVTRMLGEQLSKMWGQAVVIDNKPGASGILAMQEIKKAPADGYSYVLGDVGTLAINPLLYKTLPYDPNKDLTIVTDLVSLPWVFFVPKNGPIKTMAELIAAARAKPGELTYGTAGRGAPNSLVIGLLKLKTGIDMLEVPHKSTTDIYTGVSAGRLDLMVASLATVDAYKDRLQPIALAASDREPGAATIPTLSEASGIPKFELSAWSMVMARSDTPPKIIDKVRADIITVFANPAFREKVTKMGMRIGGKTDMRQLQETIAFDARRFGEVVEAEKLQKQ